ncbi:MAG: nuclear transport factor 2 family protein [Cyanobacteriota bacterium]|nr:nuclear transport factor 2 family protein [Cyanobacteriota bacterium]
MQPQSPLLAKTERRLTFKRLLISTIAAALTGIGALTSSAGETDRYDFQGMVKEEYVARQQRDRQQIQQLTQQWANLWSPKDQPFTGKGFEEIFAPGENEILVFDNVGGSVVVLRSLDEYLNTWVPMMEQFTFWEIAIDDNLEISVSGDLAATTFSFSGGGRDRDGSEYQLRQYGTHVWQRIDGRWRLVREHLTLADVPE